jgi:hypothetical protein
VLALRLVPDYALKDEWAFRVAYAAVGFFVMSLAIISMSLAGAAAASVLKASPDRQLHEYRRLRADLHDFLNAAAAIIIVAAALRAAVIAATESAEGFPPEYLVYFGGFYSALLAFAYAPAHRAHHKAGTVLRDKLLPIPAGPVDSWADWLAERKALDALLQLDVVSSKAITTGLAFATPLLGAGAGLVLGIGA